MGKSNGYSRDEEKKAASRFVRRKFFYFSFQKHPTGLVDGTVFVYSDRITLSFSNELTVIIAR